MASHRRMCPFIVNKQKYESDLKLFSNMKTWPLTFVEHSLTLSGSDAFSLSKILRMGPGEVFLRYIEDSRPSITRNAFQSMQR